MNIIDNEPLPLKAAAAQYAGSGRVVFPVGGEDGKKPLVRWGGLVPGPRHVLQVRAWWRKWSDANIGLRTGNGLVVVDVDTRHGGAIDTAWPSTRASQTRSGGFHLFYSASKPVRCSVSVVAQGVDIRGEGGYVVVPPSSGWQWLNDEPLAELPASIANVTPAGAAGRGGCGDAVMRGDWKPFELLEEVSCGGRNDYLVVCLANS